jgi:hypothetical protein
LVVALEVAQLAIQHTLAFLHTKAAVAVDLVVELVTQMQHLLALLVVVMLVKQAVVALEAQRLAQLELLAETSKVVAVVAPQLQLLVELAVLVVTLAVAEAVLVLQTAITLVLVELAVTVSFASILGKEQT